MERWWDGPLAVERLAWDAVVEVRDAVQALAMDRGQSWRLGTSPELVAASFDTIGHLRIDGRAPAGFAPLSGFFAAQDGWIRTHANFPHHAAALTRALGVSDRDPLVATLAGRSAADAVESILAAGGIATVVRTPEEWAAHEHGRATAAEPWVRVSTHADRAPLTGGTLPLAGVRVLDLTRVIAGPTASQVLGCLGADVLRVDPPRTLELLDQYLSNAQGKRSVELDLAATDRLESLLADADVVLLGYRPGSLDGFGLNPDDLAQRHPHLVIGSLSAWGETGPWAQRAGFDSIVQAATGIAVRCGQEKPGALPVQALDHATGHRLAAHVVHLLHRAEAGIVRISLLGAARTLLALPAPGDTEPFPLEVPTIELDTPHGHLVTVPPPLTVDGSPITGPVGRYAGSEARWA